MQGAAGAHETQPKGMNYRREIDGLRALAVLPVILFHAGFPLFGGGFVGVDVFFVISGYLITTLMLNERAAGRFSIVRFYERRARRILPMLFTVVLACVPFAWVWLLPGDMKSFAESQIAVALFSSNILFWQQSGYFDAGAALKPLHHTWSLAVEEQFYVLFPLFLAAAWRLGRTWLFALLGAMAVTSLALAEWGSIHSRAATFFLLPTRAWELLAGALVALWLIRRDPPALSRSAVMRVVHEAGGLAGLVLIGYATFAFSKTTPFPGFHALLPVGGTALIVLFATPQTFAGRLLGLRPLVFVGLISYSAYLWHQPLFVFARYASLDPLTTGEYLGLAVAALVLAALSWRFIEAPFRDRQRISARAVLLFSVSGSVLIAGVGLAGYLTNGFANRYGGERGEFLDHFNNEYPDWRLARRTNIDAVVREDCNFYDIPRFRLRRATDLPRPAIAADCYTRDARLQHAVLVWGDSHAQQLYAGLKANLPASWQLLQVASSACEARIVKQGSRTDYCDQSNYFAVETIRNARPDVVVIAQNLNHDAARLAQLQRDLAALGVRKVLFVGPVPHWNWRLYQLMAYRLWENTPQRTFSGLDKTFLAADSRLKEKLAGLPGAAYASPIDYLCNPQGCLTYLGNDRKLGITTYDYGHLSPLASDAFAKDVLVPLILKQ
jgi:peptidoglycan/LPS O-acetylase OafA/YrhL